MPPKRASAVSGLGSSAPRKKSKTPRKSQNGLSDGKEKTEAEASDLADAPGEPRKGSMFQKLPPITAPPAKQQQQQQQQQQQPQHTPDKQPLGVISQLPEPPVHDKPKLVGAGTTAAKKPAPLTHALVQQSPAPPPLSDKPAGTASPAKTPMSTARKKLSREQRKAATIGRLRTAFDDLDLDGNGILDPEELTQALTDLGVPGASVEDVSQFFLTSNALSVDDFVLIDALAKLNAIRVQKASEDAGECETLLRCSEANPTFLPDRQLTAVLGFCEIDTLRTLASVSARVRACALRDDVWKALLLKRRRAEAAMKVQTDRMLPEMSKVTGNYFEFYLAWVKQLCEGEGVRQWSSRQKAELVSSDPEIGSTLKTLVFSHHFASNPVDPEASGMDPAAPTVPTLVTGDETGVIHLRKFPALDPPVETLSEHDASVTAMEVTPTLILLASEDCTVTVWKRGDLARPAFSLIGHKEAVSALAIAEWDERVAVTGSMDRRVIMWNRLEQPLKKKSITKNSNDFAQQVVPKRTCEGHTMKISGLVLRPSVVFSASRDCLVIGWDWQGTMRYKMDGHMGPVNCIALYLPGPRPKDEARKSIPSEVPQHLRLANTSGTSLTANRSESAAGVQVIELPSDNVVTACGGGLIKLWNFQGRLQVTKRVHESPIETMQVCSKLQLIVSASWGSDICIFNPATSAVVAQLKGHDGVIRSVFVDEARHRIVSGSDDKTIGVWRFENVSLKNTKPIEITPYYVLRGPKQPITHVEVIRDSDQNWHAIVAVVKDKCFFTWICRPDAPMQTQTG